MAIRDENGQRLQIANAISDRLKASLTPIFEKAMDDGITPEEFIYLAIEEADSISFCYRHHIE